MRAHLDSLLLLGVSVFLTTVAPRANAQPVSQPRLFKPKGDLLAKLKLHRPPVCERLESKPEFQPYVAQLAHPLGAPAKDGTWGVVDATLTLMTSSPDKRTLEIAHDGFYELDRCETFRRTVTLYENERRSSSRGADVAVSGKTGTISLRFELNAAPLSIPLTTAGNGVFQGVVTKGTTTTAVTLTLQRLTCQPEGCRTDD